MNIQTRQNQSYVNARPASLAFGFADHQVAVIGAGPHGLSISAHLRAAGLDVVTFGEPMSFWETGMPRGMKLRSPWRGSFLSDAAGRFTLARYADDMGFVPQDPFPLETFVSYGKWFQQILVPNLDRRKVGSVEADPRGYRLTLADGDVVTARTVVLAVGLTNQEYVPELYRNLPGEMVSHTAAIPDPARFMGRKVVVVGGGQSAVGTAVLMQEAGAEVALVSREDVRWIGSENAGMRQQRSLKWMVHRALAPPNPTGPFPLNWIAAMPDIFRLLPQSGQDKLADRCLKPAVSAYLSPRLRDMAVHPGQQVTAAGVKGRSVELTLGDGRTVAAEHVVLGTGFSVDVRKPGILSPGILETVKTEDGFPVLDRRLQSSREGLYFASAAAARSLGPQMRFVWGSGIAAPRITHSILAR
jgi:NADPH-dependent 2,4-dienoyl-CoA reductase/sulfur reductase-like enzyme